MNLNETNDLICKEMSYDVDVRLRLTSTVAL